MRDGYVSLHRTLRAKGYYKKSKYVHLWVHLLMTACYKDQEFMGDGGVIHLKRGQLLTSRKLLAKETGIAEGSIENILRVLESEHQIGQQKHSKYRIITILNWDKFQNPTPLSTPREHHADTYNKDNKDNNLSAKAETYKVEPDLLIEEEKTRRPKKTTPQMQSVFDIFIDNPARYMWHRYPIQRETAALLESTYGIAELDRRYQITRKYKNEDLCPQIDTPKDFLDKMPKMERFLKNL